VAGSCEPGNESMGSINVKSTHMVGKNVYRILVENLKERDHLQDLDRGGRILIKRISKKYDKKAHMTHMVQDKD
jgi:hypothetical protein